MSRIQRRLSDADHLEVFEGLLDLCMVREEEISKLSARLEEVESLLSDYSIANTLERNRNATFSDKKGILVADSSEVMRRSLVNLLKSHGYKVVGEAENGKDAVQIYKQRKPALVTLDPDIPLMNGYDATREMKKFDPSAKVIIIGHNLDREMIVKAISAGAVDFLVKPVRIGRLLQIVERVVA